ncbi:hypothetical protein B0T18DRAFT_44666 [Schizothecium vesticola]|uniref:Uncharacterized protein n=1 Tax=Schizothecium vesticola TaxID=314040 RepID=A0AA40FBJ3_9PEZI|nr:hypothetical protein B0T18DRAFT_44666 [Schizothecium vesticola]
MPGFYFPLSLFGECCTPRWDFVVCGWSSTFEICVAAGISYFLGRWGVLGRSDWEEGGLVGGGVIFLYFLLLGLNDDEERRGLGRETTTIGYRLGFFFGLLVLSWSGLALSNAVFTSTSTSSTTTTNNTANDGAQLPWVGGWQAGWCLGVS